MVRCVNAFIKAVRYYILMKYVVLLRGVNAGGKNRVSQSDFQKVLESYGFSDVRIYINSGNAIVSNSKVPDSEAVQFALEKHFGFAIPALIIAKDRFLRIANSIPDSWTNDPIRPDKSGQKSDVIFLFDEINTPEIIDKIGHKPDVETMIYIDGAVITNVSRANQLKSSLQKLISNKAIYDNVTIRSINTVKKLALLVE